MSAKHGRYKCLDSKQTSQWNAENMPTSQLLIHRLLYSLVSSHSTTYLNYWNMCRLDYAIMLAATLLAPTRYQTISKHHAASNMTIITYIEKIVRFWSKWWIPRRIYKYRSNWCIDSSVDRPTTAVVLTILSQAGRSGWCFEDDFESIFSMETLCIWFILQWSLCSQFLDTINKRRVKYWHRVVRDRSLPV